VEKRHGIFGWWPLWQEVIPRDETGSPDKALLVGNVGAGVMIGIRQGLSAIMTASLIFTSAGIPELDDMFGMGISMMWYSSAIAAVWYGLFGRMQFGLIGINDVIGILWGTIGAEVGLALAEEPEKIAPTQLAVIGVSSVLTGLSSILFGQLGLGKLMLLFPQPVTSGFLGSIGLFIFKSSLQISSGVKFRYLWPVSFPDFCKVQPLARVACMFGALFFMRNVPPLLVKAFPKSGPVKKLGGLVCQLLPLFFFFLAARLAGVDMDELTDEGWTYPKQGSGSPLAIWTTYDLRDADWTFVVSKIPSMGLIVMMSVLCTMTGVLGIAGKFPTGPSGDPAPNETIDYDRELLTAGWADLILGCTGGILVFHRLGSTVQLRLDGGTHRIAIFTCSIFCFGLFLSGLPLGHVIPTWFLGGLFMNSSIALMQDALLSYRKLPLSNYTLFGKQLPSMQYGVTIACIVLGIVVSPFAGIFTGLALSVFIFLWQSSQSEPVSGVTSGNLSVGRTKRPAWELQCLRKEGDRIILLFLQGQLFFGSADHISKTIHVATSEAGRVKFCILSFARVIGIDASAAAVVKASVSKAERNGVKVLFCRMSPEVFKELSVAGAIKSPDQPTRKVMKDRGVDIEEIEPSKRTAEDTSNGDGHEHSEHVPHAPVRSLQRRMTCEFTPIGVGTFDAFDTESDALDFCNDVLLEEHFYAKGVDAYKLAYRRAFTKGQRLDEANFEAMNSLPRGTLDRLRPFCKVMDSLNHYEILDQTQPTLYFIMRGAISQLEELSSEDENIHRSVMLKAEVKGFAGRGGKRLRARYTPGHVVGKTKFFVGQCLVDQSMLPTLQVSSRVAGYCEVWQLRRSSWDAMPSDLKSVMQELMLFQVCDDRQHALMCE